MIQGGDPTGTGRGGSSIFGDKFEDEIRDDLKRASLSLSLSTFYSIALIFSSNTSTQASISTNGPRGGKKKGE